MITARSNLTSLNAGRRRYGHEVPLVSPRVAAAVLRRLEDATTALDLDARHASHAFGTGDGSLLTAVQRAD